MEYELKQNVPPGYIYNEMLTKYPDGMPKLVWTETKDKIVLRFEGEFDEEELKQFLDGITEQEWDKEKTRTIVIERISFTKRIKDLQEFCKGKDLDFKFLPKSSGCFDKPPYTNFQRYFFTRSLTEKEKEEVKEILKQEIIIDGW